MELQSNIQVNGDREPIPINAWATFHAVGMLAAVAAASVLGTAAPIALTAAGSFAALWHRDRHWLAELKPFGGYANQLTALRLTLILGAAAFMTEVSQGWLLLLFAVNVAMDVADGRLARRMQQDTRFGTVFDRETDAVFVLVVYLYFFLVHSVGAWILLPGLLPYVDHLLRGLRGSSVPDRRQRHAVVLAGTNYLLLLIAAAAAAPYALPVLIVSTSVVLASFAVSFWISLRNEYSIP